MSDDVKPMEPCPVTKYGKHVLNVVIPDDTEGWLTLFCEHCGALRRAPVSGTLTTLDSLDAETIARVVRGA